MINADRLKKGGCKMNETHPIQWIPFAEGDYIVERAWLISPAKRALELHQAVISVFTGRSGQRQLSGRALVKNTGMIELLEDGEGLDLLVDLGAEFKYFLKHPKLNAGKVLDPEVRSHLQFMPREPWQMLSSAEFDACFTALQMVS